MKKIYKLVMIIWLLLSSLLLAKSYMGLELPSGINIQLSLSGMQNQEESLATILKKCEKYNLDIYKSEYLGSIDNKELYKIYYTNSSSNNVMSSLSIQNGPFMGRSISTEYSRDHPFVKAFNIDVNHVFYDLKSAINDTTLEGVYKVLSSDEHSVDAFINELKDEGINVTMIGQGTSVQTYENVEICIFFMIIILLISFYIIIQNQKEVSIKKLNGYSNKNIILENNLRLVKLYVFYVVLISLIDIIVLLLFNEYDSMSDYILMFWFIHLISFMVILVLNNIANIYLLKINPVASIKNLSKDVILDIASMLIKVATLFMIILYVSSLLHLLSSVHDLSSNVKSWENTKEIAYTITQGYYPTTKEEEILFEEKFKYLYTNLNEKKSAVLMDATSCYSTIPKGKSHSWSYDHAKIVVNRNYIRDSTIPNTIINKIDEYDDGATVLLIPSLFKEEEEKIRNNYFENLPLNHKDISRIKTLLYDVNLSIFTANLEVQTKGNIVKNPIVVIDDNNFESYYYLSAFSSGSIYIPIQNINAPYNEIKDSLVAAKLDDTIKLTPLVYSRYSNQISEFNSTIAKIALQLFLLFIISSVLIYHSIILFITKCNKEIAIKKMIGYRKSEIYVNYYKDLIFIWLITSLCIYLYLGHLNYLITLLVFIVFELLVTFLVIAIQERKNILSMLKGNN